MKTEIVRMKREEGEEEEKSSVEEKAMLVNRRMAVKYLTESLFPNYLVKYTFGRKWYQ